MKNKKEKQNSIQENEIQTVISAKQYANLSYEERKLYTPIKDKYEKIPLITKILFGFALLGIIIYIISMISESFADFYNINIAHYFRMIFAKISNVLPFSIAEAIIISIPFIAFIIIWYIWKYRCSTFKTTLVAIINLCAALAFIVSSFTLNFAAGYKGSSLDKKLELEKSPVSATELYDTATYLINKANEESSKISFDSEGFSKMPYGINEMNDKLIEAYDEFCKKYDFIKNFDSNIKPVMLSEAMSYTHITGVYTFFTGEANINIAFPDYTIPYTAAHELAHQRGIAREDEANMIAYLVCMESSDPYIRYSAYVNMYEYIASPLRRADSELYTKARGMLNTKISAEQLAYANFYKKYQKSVAATVSNKVNDTYLKAQGTSGSVSYGMVVDLTVAYFKEQGIIE